MGLPFNSRADGDQWPPATAGSAVDTDFLLVDTWGALQDPDSNTDGASGTDGTICTFEMVTSASVYLGHQTNAPGNEVRLRSLPGLEDYNPQDDILEFYVELLEYTPADYTARFGPALCIVDDDYANRATAVGIGYHLRPASATTSLLINVGPTSGLGSAGSATGEPHTSFTARFTGIRGAADYRLETGGSMYDAAISVLGALSQRSSPMSQDPDDWYLQLRIYKNDANTATPTIKARVWYRRMRRAPVHPHLVRGVKATTTVTGLLLGDSISRGYGVSDGGDALPAGVRVWDVGVEEVTNWMTGNGAPDDAPGYLRGIAAGALADGVTDLELHRWGTNGGYLLTMMQGDVGSACLEFAALRETIDVIFLAVGTNNSLLAAPENTDAFEATIEQDMDGLQTMFPNARIVHFHPIVDDAGWPGADRVRAAITRACAVRPRSRAVVQGKGDATADINHPNLATYLARGTEAWEAYAALP